MRDPMEDPDYWDYREEELQLRALRKRLDERASAIARDPFYPPEWAANEKLEVSRTNENH